jgi:hypothetical protein
MRLAVLIAALALTAAGCSRQLVDRVADPTSMRSAILALVPIGTSIDHAAQRLEPEGLKCQPSSVARFGDREPLLYAYCDGRSRGAFTYRRWQIALVDSAGRVSDVLVASGMVGL